MTSPTCFCVAALLVVTLAVYATAQADSSFNSNDVASRGVTRPVAPPSPPSPPSPFSPRAIVAQTLVPILGCRMEPTQVLLGYSFENYGAPVYQNSCNGLCLARRKSVCSPIFKKIVVSTVPFYIGSDATSTANATELSTTRGGTGAVAGVEATATIGRFSPSASQTLSSSSLTKTVDLIVGCQCTPAPCKVTTNYITVTYPHGATVYDSCDRKCKCSYGQLVDCCRRRKEARLGMTALERERYIKAVKYVGSVGSPFKTQFDNLINKHQNLFISGGIHNPSLFFPWHREFIWDLETLLQNYDCRVTVPYWRWSLEAAAPFASSVWGSGNDALGGDGSGSPSCVQTGPFAASTGWLDSQTVPQCLNRNWFTSATFATESAISNTMNVAFALATQVSSFSNTIQGYHNTVHGSIGGQMGNIVSSNDPVFFWHHCYIDYLWAQWQAKSYAHLWALPVNTYMNTSMPGSTFTAGQFMDLNAQQGDPTKRVCYVPLKTLNWVDDVLTAKAAELDTVPRVGQAPFPASWLRAMRVSEADYNRSKAEFDEYNASPYTITRNAAACNGPISSTLGMYLYDADFEKAGYGTPTASNVQLYGGLTITGDTFGDDPVPRDSYGTPAPDYEPRDN